MPVGHMQLSGFGRRDGQGLLGDHTAAVHFEFA